MTEEFVVWKWSQIRQPARYRILQELLDIRFVKGNIPHVVELMLLRGLYKSDRGRELVKRIDLSLSCHE